MQFKDPEHQIYLHINAYSLMSAVREFNISMEDAQRIQGLRSRYYRNMLRDNDNQKESDVQQYLSEYGHIYGSSSFNPVASSDETVKTETDDNSNSIITSESDVIESEESDESDESDINDGITNDDDFDEDAYEDVDYNNEIESDDGFMTDDDVNQSQHQVPDENSDEIDKSASDVVSDTSSDNVVNDTVESDVELSESSEDEKLKQAQETLRYLSVFKSISSNFSETIDSCDKSVEEIENEIKATREKLKKLEEDLRYLKSSKDVHTHLIGLIDQSIKKYETSLEN